MTDVVLLYPADNSKMFGGMPPLGLCSIASFLRLKGISTELFDLQICEINVPDIIRHHNPKIVGIGGTSHTRFESFRIAQQVKEIDSSIIVVYGGPHASFTATDTLTHIPHIDIIARGEGEIIMLDVAVKVLSGEKDFSDIKGISYRSRSSIKENPPAQRIQNLDMLPFARRSSEMGEQYLLKMEFLGTRGASVITSRGCPINCSFCSASAMFGSRITLRSAKNVVEEIEYLIKENGVQGIKFFDSTLTLKRNHVESLCDEIQRRKLRFPWECEIRVNTVDRELLMKMRKAGCYYVDLGIESASEHVLRFMHKQIQPEQAVKVLQWTKDLGVYTKVFFTFGHIHETLEDACKTIEFMERYSRYITSVATSIGIRIYPGTKVEQYARSIGCLDNNFSWSLPYREEKIQALGNDPCVPILIQPTFGWEEFARVESRLAWFWLKNPRLAYQAFQSQMQLKGGKELIATLWHAAKLQRTSVIT